MLDACGVELVKCGDNVVIHGYYSDFVGNFIRSKAKTCI